MNKVEKGFQRAINVPLAGLLALSMGAAACASGTTETTGTIPPPTAISTTTTPEVPTTSNLVEEPNNFTHLPNPEPSTGEWDILPPDLDSSRSVPKGTSQTLGERPIPEITQEFENQSLNIFLNGNAITGKEVSTGFVQTKEYDGYTAAQISGYLVGYHEIRTNNFFGFSANPPTIAFIVIAGRNMDGSTWKNGFFIGRPDQDSIANWYHFNTEEISYESKNLTSDSTQIHNYLGVHNKNRPISEVGDVLEDKAFWRTPQVIIDLPINITNPPQGQEELFNAGGNKLTVNNKIFRNSQDGETPSGLIGWVTGITTST